MRGQFAPCAGRQAQGHEGKSPYGGTNEAQGGMAYGGGHAADLAVPAFGQGEGDPAVGNGLAHTDWGEAGRPDGGWIEFFRPGGKRAPTLDHHAVGELAECFRSDKIFHLGVIGAGMAMLRFEQGGDHRRFVGQEKETLGITVEPADRINAGRKSKPGESMLARNLRGELRQHVEGFEERDDHLGARLKSELPGRFLARK